MYDDRPSFAARVAAVKAKLPIGAVVERHVKLSGTSGSKARRGKCPFHSGKSASFSVTGDYAHCFGCQWHGDVVKFVTDHFRLSPIEALEDCEADAGIASLTRSGAREREARPVQRERNPSGPPMREWQGVAAIDMGRWIWKRARRQHEPVRRYFMGRGVPEAMLTDARLTEFRYLAECPAVLWEQGKDPRKVIHNPAVVALVRRPVVLASADGTDGRLELVPVGVHVTYLHPDGSSTMLRRKPWAKQAPDGSWDEDSWLPKRRMLGPVKGGAVFLGAYRPDAHLWIGEGNETVLSAMALGHAPDDAVGVAALSLDNLQGPVLTRQGRYGPIWPLYAIEPDTGREWAAFDVPGHRARVTGLVDSDMSPFNGFQDQGENVIEHKGGPIIRRPITGAERAQICGELFVKVWRSRGCQSDAVRAPAGMDFNDVVRSAA